jgi:hypothetical protein
MGGTHGILHAGALLLLARPVYPAQCPVFFDLLGPPKLLD